MASCLLLSMALLGWITQPVYAADEFKTSNPDGGKYEFARSYITALGYLNRIDQRWINTSPKKIYAGSDDHIIKANINGLAMDNADLRIVKNYLVKYLSSSNALMRKTVDTAAFACDMEIAVNNEEKILWAKWEDLKAAKQATADKEKAFVRRQQEIALKRKEADKEMIQASVLMTKVLVSEKNSNDQGHQLAITAKEREKLLGKLDSFGKDTLTWGLEEGQRTLEASIAVIREILEDPIWVSIDEK